MELPGEVEPELAGAPGGRRSWDDDKREESAWGAEPLLEVPRDSWQCLETFMFVETGDRRLGFAVRLQQAEAGEAAGHPSTRDGPSAEPEVLQR